MSIPQLPKLIRVTATTLADVCTKINTFMQNVQQVLDYIAGKPQLDSIILSNITLKSDIVNLVPHTLNRPLTGWKQIGLTAQATLWDTQLTNNNKAIYLNLKCSADCVVSLEVF